jgi:hypothetical protein
VNDITNLLNKITVGQPVSSGSMFMFPLFGTGKDASAFRSPSWRAPAGRPLWKMTSPPRPLTASVTWVRHNHIRSNKGRLEDVHGPRSGTLAAEVNFLRRGRGPRRPNPRARLFPGRQHPLPPEAAFRSSRLQRAHWTEMDDVGLADGSSTLQKQDVDAPFLKTVDELSAKTKNRRVDQHRLGT